MAPEETQNWAVQHAMLLKEISNVLALRETVVGVISKGFNPLESSRVLLEPDVIYKNSYEHLAPFLCKI
jgi:hypothetical protein